MVRLEDIRRVAVAALMMLSLSGCGFLEQLWQSIAGHRGSRNEQGRGGDSGRTNNSKSTQLLFDWSMERRFGATVTGTKHVPATSRVVDVGGRAMKITYPAYNFDYSVTDYQQNKCFIHPGICEIYPYWNVVLDGTRSGGVSFKWTIPDGNCGPTDQPTIKCGFRSLGEHTVELEIRDGAGQKRIDRREINLRDLVIVSIGDSLASGEGVPDVHTQKRNIGTFLGQPVEALSPPIWQEAQCHLSANAGPALAGKLLEDADPHTSVTFIHLACSGATIDRGLLGRYDGIETGCSLTAGGCWPAKPPQVDALAELLCPISRNVDGNTGRVTRDCPVPPRKIHALMVSIGANDIEFGDIVKACVVFLNCHLRGETHDTMWSDQLNGFARVIARAKSGSKIAALSRRYADLNRALRNKLLFEKPDAIVISEYHDPTHKDGGFCTRDGGDAQLAAREELRSWLKWVGAQTIYDVVDFEGITHDEFQWAYKHVVLPLNDAVRAAATDNGWTFVKGVREAFHDHGVCANDNWIVGFDASLRNQLNYEGTLHPNVAGHQHYGRLLAVEIARLTGIQL